MKTEFSVGKIGQDAMSLLQAHCTRKDEFKTRGMLNKTRFIWLGNRIQGCASTLLFT